MRSHFIQVELSIRQHPKTLRLCRLIGSDGRWVPIYLWLYCMESAQDGDLSKLDASDLAGVIGYTGNAKKLRAALIKSGWLDRGGIVHGWDERYTEKIRFYKERAKKGADALWAKRRASPSTPPPSEEENQTREEERRGDKISKHATSMLEAGVPPPPPSDWPLEIPEGEIPALELESGFTADEIRHCWKSYYAKKIRFGDDFEKEKFFGFTDYLKNPKEGGKLRKDYSTAKLFEQAAQQFRPDYKPQVEPENWREATRELYPDAVFLNPESPFYAKTYSGLTPEHRPHVERALEVWKAKRAGASFDAGT